MTSTANYARFLAHRARAERAIGRHIVSTLEAGQSIASLVADTGRVHGTDRDPRSLIALSGASMKRRAAAASQLTVENMLA